MKNRQKKPTRPDFHRQSMEQRGTRLEKGGGHRREPFTPGGLCLNSAKTEKRRGTGVESANRKRAKEETQQ